MTKEGIEFIKKEWISALRSGKYTQGRSKLHDTDEQFCCLGVACELLKDKLNLNVIKNKYSYSYNGAYEYLPLEVMDYIGFTDGEQERLAILNDVNEYSFKQIADHLEDKILQLEAQPVSVPD